MGYLDQVEQSKPDENFFVCIFGVGGVGKSTFGADAPSPVFIRTEKGTGFLKVNCLPNPKNFSEIGKMVDELYSTNHKFKTLVIDSLDWAEPLCWAEVCQEQNVKSVGDVPYGKGYEAALNKWQSLMHKLKLLREKMNIVLIAHASVKTFQDPVQATAYDRYEIKLHGKSAALIKEAVDAVLFATYEVFTKRDGQKTRAFGDGARVLLTQYRPSHDGKNRMSLPYQLPLSWEEFVKATKNPASDVNIKEEIAAMVSQVKDEDLRKKVMEAVEKAGTDQGQLAKIQNRLRIKLEG